jgi:hypothetical protein
MHARTPASVWTALAIAIVAVSARVRADVRAAATTPSTQPITFNLNFEGASLGTIETLADATFRCHVEGQHDERGHNRQASWYYFRMDHVNGRDVTLTLTDFVGEYNDKPGACPMGPDIVPVYSYDGRTWKHFDRCAWDDAKKEATICFRGEADTIWIAHVPPYTPRDLRRLLDDVRRSPHAMIEVIGKTVQGRDIPLVTVTDLGAADAAKRVVWLQARQHAWEAGTSYVMEGALRFVISDDPAARALREKVIFKFTPLVDLDGCANGKVRFNANNYDVNRHWDAVDLRNPDMLRLMPEIWYTKKAIAAQMSRQPIDLMVNLHNTETGEYLATSVDDPTVLGRIHGFERILAARTTFDSSRPLTLAGSTVKDTNLLWSQHRVPVMLMEQRIATSKKLGRRPTVEDRLIFGRALPEAMAEAVITSEPRASAPGRPPAGR